MVNVFPMQLSWILHDDPNPRHMRTLREEKGDGFVVRPSLPAFAPVFDLHNL